ncbi:MAG: hypothetical protein QOF67_36 [Mycobacterium sp.]|nr:hypothetical protein [Mycobacterium sp.]
MPTGAALSTSPGLVVTVDGAVIDALDIAGSLDIKANNVTVQRSRITSSRSSAVRVLPGYTGFQLVDSEVVGVNSLTSHCGVAVSGSGVTLARVDIHDCEDGFHPGNNSTIQDSYIHDLWIGTYLSGVSLLDTHNDGIQVMSGSHFVIRHNRIEIGHNQNAAIFVKADFGAISDVVIDGNYLDGGGYTIFGGDTKVGLVTDVTITNNTFGPSSVYGILFTSRWTGPTLLSLNVTSSGQTVKADPLLVAAGGIACEPAELGFTGNVAGRCAMGATAALAASFQPTVVAALGDTQYGKGRLSAYRQGYATSWGALLPITRPTVGDVEYATGSASGYFSYFAGRGGTAAKGWYSYDVGAWHVVVLNSECRFAGGCGPTSPQVKWLARDLAAHPTTCTLAYWHEPRFSSGPAGSNPAYNAFWNALYKGHVDVVLNAHQNAYERFTPMNPNGRYDARGIREFVVGTGGHGLTPFKKTATHSLVRNASSFGVLALSLHATSYEWKFASTPGSPFSDSGSASCH